MIIINNEVNMIISSANDYRQGAKRKVPPFMFHYADGGSYSEHTLKCKRSI